MIAEVGMRTDRVSNPRIVLVRSTGHLLQCCFQLSSFFAHGLWVRMELTQCNRRTALTVACGPPQTARLIAVGVDQQIGDLLGQVRHLGFRVGKTSYNSSTSNQAWWGAKREYG